MTRRKTLIYIILIATIVLLVWLVPRGCSRDESHTPHSTLHTDTTRVLLTQMQHVSRLHTAEVKVHKIITHDDVARVQGKLLGQDVSVQLPMGNRKVAIPLYATVTASIDMSRLTADDIIRTGDHIEVYLPQPEVVITETHIDHDGVRQYVALTRSRFSDEELQSYEKQGRQAIEADLKQLNIDEMARENAARQLIPILRAMGYSEENITISFRQDDHQTNTINRKRE